MIESAVLRRARQLRAIHDASVGLAAGAQHPEVPRQAADAAFAELNALRDRVKRDCEFFAEHGSEHRFARASADLVAVQALIRGEGVEA